MRKKTPVTAETAVPPRQKTKVREWLIRGSIGLAGFLVVVIALQFLYPTDRSLPNASVNGKSAGNKTVNDLAPLLQTAFQDTSVTLKANNVTAEAKLPALGATLDSRETALQLMEYRWWQRLLPFSLLWIQPTVKDLRVTFSDTELTAKTTELAATMTSQPKNGTVGLTAAGEVTITPAEDGVSVTTEEAAKAAKAAAYKFGANTVLVTPKATAPTITNDMLSKVKDRIAGVLAVQPTLKNSLDAKTASPDKATVASWIHIGDDLSLSLDKGKVAEYANQFAKAQLLAAGTAKITTLDGVETGHIDAPAGRGVNLDALTADLSKALFENGTTTVAVQFVTIAPSVTYSRTYSSSQAGLQAYISDVTRGTNIEISVRQLTGAGWSASAGASKSVVSASTYKLFVASVLFDKINAGQIRWSDPVQGTNVDGCLRNTIVVSANNCSEEWLEDWGNSNVNAALYAKGISSATTFTAADAVHTSAADLQTLLIGLYGQSLFTPADSGKLLDLMKQQVYRQGIPAGSAGTVADKVGFLWDYLHDAAIVYHPKGTYVLVVMTKGQTWGKIAEITHQVEAIMYP